MTEDVSRETPPVPSEALGVFHDRLPLAVRYRDLLATVGVERGLIGPREESRLWERHLLNCGVVSTLIKPGQTVADIGSGAGLPGIPLAIACPEAQFTLIEPLLRRSTFLEEVVSELGLRNVSVVRARADALHGTREFEVVTSRAVAPLDRLVPWSIPLVRHYGRFLALKGASVRNELEEASSVARKFGAVDPVFHSLGEGLLVSPTTVLELRAAKPSRLRLAPQSGRKKKR